MTELLYGDGAIRRPSLYGSSIENTYAGVLSFMRRKYTRELDGVDAAISGVPLDLATTFRSGARLGPAAVRAASVHQHRGLRRVCALYVWQRRIQ